MSSMWNRRQFLEAQLACLGLGSLGISGCQLALSNTITTKPPLASQGISLAGAEFGTNRMDFCNENPGRLGKDYTYNSAKTVAYFAKQGVRQFRIPFRWERIQPQLGNALDPTELAALQQVARWAAENNAGVILDVHNYARYSLRYQGEIRSCIIDQRIDQDTPVTTEHFVDLWQRLAKAFATEPGILAYGLMNEPHDLGDSDWKSISQAAVDGIREVDPQSTILVAGDGWSNAHRWTEVNGSEAWIKDPSNRIAYEAHCYFDHDFSGKYRLSYEQEQSKDPAFGQRPIHRLRPFVDWCQKNQVEGYLGEYGVPANDSRWIGLLRNFLAALNEANFGGCYWAAGEWWGDYPLSIQPADEFQTPAPQLATIANARQLP